MKKITLFAIGLLSLPFMVNAQSGTSCSNCEQAPNVVKSTSNYDKALWDIQLDVDPTTVFSPATGLAGVAWTGTEFWVSKWNNNALYTANAAGAMTGSSFTIAGVSGTRSITTDGTFMYIGTAGTSIYQINIATKTLASTISTSVPSCRYLTYDAALDGGSGGFWTGAYGSDIVSVSMAGTTLSTISSGTHGLTGIYGMAHDPYTTGGPFIWAFDQGGNGADIVQLSMAGVPTGVVRDATVDFGASSAGGLFICSNYVAGQNSMIGLIQGTSLFSYELSDPLANDAKMDALNVSSYVAAGNVNISGTVKNLGLNTINSIDVSWDSGSGANTQTFAVTIPTNGTYNFNHSTALVAALGSSYSLNVTVTLAGDGNLANNSLTQNVTVISSIPAKTVVGEEKTGSWCQWCPRGAVGLANMESESDFIGIAVHNGDPMTVTSYDGAIGTYVPGGYPGGGVDRVIETDPNAAAFLAAHNTRKTATVPCKVNSITATYYSSTKMISVSTIAEFFGNIPGNFRLSCVIVQDNLSSTASGWSQSNAYSGGGSGPMQFPAGMNNSYNFSTGPSSVPSADFGGYDHVARSLSDNDILGNSGSLPAGTVSAGVHNYTFSDVSATAMPGASNAPFVMADAHAIVMIIDASTGEILNAAKASIDFPTSVEDLDAAKFNLKAFPNPTNNVSTLSFYLAESANVSLEIFNSVGSIVYTKNVETLNSGTQKITFDGTDLPSGIYFVNLTIGEQTITKKISLLK